MGARKKSWIFWEGVDIQGPTQCWQWLGYTAPNGYGDVTFKSRKWKVHRVSYHLCCGAIPVGMFVCHKCDNPSCVNPNHLFLGTCADNLADMVAKGRSRVGIRHHNAKVTPRQIAEIRAAPQVVGIVRDLAIKFGLSHQQISKIRSHTRWKHL